MSKKSNVKVISQNKKAFHDYFILETYQAGIELKGTEVKALRAGLCNLKDSYIKIENNQAILKNMHISPYSHGNLFNHEPLRDRVLLLHKYEIRKLIGKSEEIGYSLVPIKIYFSGRYIKIDISVVKGKKLYDKRHEIAKKEQMRNAEKEFKLKLQV